MQYYFTTTLENTNFDDAINLVTEALKKEGFGILSEIDVRETFKKKLDINFKKYKRLGACNPEFAHKAISYEDKIGVFLPCNILVEESDNNSIEVSAVDPIASMSAVENDKLGSIAQEVQSKLKRVIESLIS